MLSETVLLFLTFLVIGICKKKKIALLSTEDT